MTIEISLIFTQLVVLFLLVKTYRVSKKVSRLERLIAKMAMKDLHSVFSKLFNNIEKNDKKSSGNGKNKHKNSKRPA